MRIVGHALTKLTCFKDGGKLLKNPWKSQWVPENPTQGYCYIVCEAFYHYGNIKTVPYVHNFGDLGTHWWLVDEDNDVVFDPTGDQFNFSIDYVTTGRRASFFKGSIETPRGFISKRGFAMAKQLGLVN